MDTVLRAVVIYLLIVVLLRLSGKRTMSELTTVDLVLLLIVSEATQQALLGDDFSLTTAALVITTLVLLDRCADIVKFRSNLFSRLMDGTPLVLVQHGKPIESRLKKEHIDIDDVLSAARMKQGLLTLEQIDFAILESSGGISIIPANEPAARPQAKRSPRDNGE